MINKRQQRFRNILLLKAYSPSKLGKPITGISNSMSNSPLTKPPTTIDPGSASKIAKPSGMSSAGLISGSKVMTGK